MFSECFEIWKAQAIIENSGSECVVSITSIVSIVTVRTIAVINVLGKICQLVGHSVIVLLCTDDGELLDATATQRHGQAKV